MYSLPKSTIPFALLLLMGLMGCEPQPPQDPEPPIPRTNPDNTDGEEVEMRWLPDERDQRFRAIEDQLAGFSQAMIEVGHRYNDLYWAGRDRNWEYAEYQLEHIAEAIEAGIIRRPGRADSARPFLDETIPMLHRAIEEEDGDSFDAHFVDFTAACTTCHVQEEVDFIPVDPPQYRLSPAVQAP